MRSRRCTCGGVLFQENESTDVVFLRCTRCVRKQRLYYGDENEDGEAQD